jgi:protein-S-isoprenylcysteine O-methyltransferase Ste14
LDGPKSNHGVAVMRAPVMWRDYHPRSALVLDRRGSLAVGVRDYSGPEQRALRAPGQTLVTRGPYAQIGHPICLEAIILWHAVSFYARSEEKMMLEHFGSAYRE